MRNVYRYVCEVCDETKDSSYKLTQVCKECLEEEATIKAEMEAQAASWAKAHKCRSCNAGLTPDRYFKCHKCDVPSLRETADEWDTEPDMSICLEPAPNPRHLKAAAKTCRRCLVTKEPSEFVRNTLMKDGLTRDCKPCFYAARRGREAIKRAQGGMAS